MKKLKKYYKIIIAALILVIISVLSFLIYVNIFKEGDSNRLENINEHELTKKEISKVKETFNELDQIKSIKIYTNYKIIKIYITLEDEVSLDKIDKLSNKAIEDFNDKNIEYYDIEIFVECLNEESEAYPKIGYKHKTNSEFTWNR